MNRRQFGVAAIVAGIGLVFGMPAASTAPSKPFTSTATRYLTEQWNLFTKGRGAKFCPRRLDLDADLFDLFHNEIGLITSLLDCPAVPPDWTHLPTVTCRAYRVPRQGWGFRFSEVA